MPAVPSTTYQARLVPLNHDRDMRDALAARVHDPLWLLARQWQFGEFQGEDAGSPVVASVETQLSGLTRYACSHNGVMDVADLPTNVPLDALVEGGPQLPGGATENYRLRAEAGQHFLRLLRLASPALEERYRPRYLEVYPLLPHMEDEVAMRADAASRRLSALLAGRVVDGVALYTDLARVTETGGLPASPIIDPPDQANVLHVASDWVTWFKEMYGLTFQGRAWDEHRLEYNLAVGAPGNFVPPHVGAGEVRLDAREHRGDRLDWYSFDRDFAPTADRQLGAAGNATPKQLFCFPTPLRFSGMATARYWEFEDRQVNLSRVSAAPEDLPRLLMMEFLLVYGNDFFGFPLDMDVGSICQIQGIEVTDTFGQHTPIPPVSGAAGPWSMYTLTPDVSAQDVSGAPLFFLAPAMGPILESQPLEQVRFFRDEMANLVWAVERIVLGQLGRPIDRFEMDQERREERRKREQAARPASSSLVYHLSSADQIPDYWFPFVPTLDASATYTLRQARLLHGLRPQRPEDAPRPWGDLLGRSRLEIPEEEIPREGVEIQRVFRLARGLDGHAVLWIGHKRKPGKGEGSSGLRYDFITAAEETSTP